MIDIHCHLLPGVDDGPRDARGTVALASLFAEDGVTAVIATPHRLNPLFPGSTRERAELAAEVARDALEAAGVPLRFEVGAEVVLTSRVVEEVMADPSLLMGCGRYVLLEIPAYGLSFQPHLADVTFRLRTEGVTPILAHVERYPEFRDEPARLEDLRARGALVQVTGPALLGRYGSDDQRAAKLFLKKGLVDVLASDAHDAVRRPPLWRESMREAERLVGKEKAAALGRGHPARVIEGAAWPT